MLKSTPYFSRILKGEDMCLKILNIVALLVMVFFFVSCDSSSGNRCSVDKDCGAGYVCDDGECKKTNAELSFEGVQNGSVFTYSDDKYTGAGDLGVQIDLAVLNTNKLPDLTEIVLTVNDKNVTGNIVNNKVSFKRITLSDGENTLEAFVKDKKTITTGIIKVKLLRASVVLYYYKDAKTITELKNKESVVSMADDSNNASDDGLQLKLSAKSSGLNKSEKINLYVKDLSDKPVAIGEVKTLDEKGEGQIEFDKAVSLPKWKSIVLVLEIGKEKTETEIEYSFTGCSAPKLNIAAGAKFGIKDDEKTSEAGLQKTLNITSDCADGSEVAVFVDSPLDGEPTEKLTLSGGAASKLITIKETKKGGELSKITVVVYDKAGSNSLSTDSSDILVDITLPECTFVIDTKDSAKVTRIDDKDDSVPGIQMGVSGSCSDNLSEKFDFSFMADSAVLKSASINSGNFEFDDITFLESIQSVDFSAKFVDEVGNAREFTYNDFSVLINNPQVGFVSLCGKTDLLDGMYLNAKDDKLTSTPGLQCDIVLSVADVSSSTTNVNLLVGGSEISAPIKDGTAIFEDVALEEGSVVLNGYLTDLGEKIESQISVIVDTVYPEVAFSQKPVQNQGDKTSATTADFSFNCGSDVCTYKYKLDDSSLWPEIFAATASVKYSNLSEGSHIFYVIARDAAGNEMVIESPISFEWIVAIAPITTITKYPAVLTKSNFAEFEFSSNETGSSFQCKLDDAVFKDCVSAKIYSDLSDGVHDFYVKATDLSGNEELAPVHYQWSIDRVAPKTKIDSVNPPQNVTKQQSATISFSSDDPSAIYKCRLSRNSSTYIDWEDCISPKTYNALQDGQYVFDVKATDSLGNEESESVSYGWTVDTSAPKVYFTSKPSDPSPYQSGEYKFTCKDEVSDTVEQCSFACTLDNSVVDCSQTYGSYSYSALSAGSHSFKVCATDLAGNTKLGNCAEFNWDIDLEAVGVSIISKPTALTNNKTATITFSSNKPDSTFECKLDDASYSSCTSPEEYLNLEDGSHLFFVKATSGGKSAEVSYEWVVDTKGPIFNSLTGPQTPTNATGGTFEFTTNESATFKCCVDCADVNSEGSSCTSPKTYNSGSFAQGAHTFKVSATDSLGNVSQTALHNWSVDTTPPEITMTSPAPNQDGEIVVGRSQDRDQSADVYAIDIVLNISGAKAGSTISVTGIKPVPAFVSPVISSENPANYTIRVGLEFGLRVSNSLEFSVTDSAGNTTKLQKIIVVNTTEPEINWGSSNNQTFLFGQTPELYLTVYNVKQGVTIELVDNDTNQVVGTSTTKTVSTESWESVKIVPNLPNRCKDNPYKFYGRFVSDLDGQTYYSGSKVDFAARKIQSYVIDTDKPVITGINHLSDDNGDKILYSLEDENTGVSGMQAGFEILVTGADGQVLTMNSTKKINGALSITGTVQSGKLLFDGSANQFISLEEGRHTFTASVKDCSGNQSDTYGSMPSFDVDTTPPTLSIVTPSGRTPGHTDWLTTIDDGFAGTINSNTHDFDNVQMKVDFGGESLKGQKVVVKKNGIQVAEHEMDNDDYFYTFTLPSLSNTTQGNPHAFTVEAKDKGGNSGASSSRNYTVDTISPTANITYPLAGTTPDTPLLDEGGLAGAQFHIALSYTDSKTVTIQLINAGDNLTVNLETELALPATSGTNVSFKLDGGTYQVLKTGWYSIKVFTKDDHLNESLIAELPVYIYSNAPDVRIYKYWNNTKFAQLTNTDNWILHDEGSADVDRFDTQFRIETDLPEGHQVIFYVNRDDADQQYYIKQVAADGSVMIGTGADSPISLRTGADESNKIAVVIVWGAELLEEIPNVKVDMTDIETALVQPTQAVRVIGGNTEIGYGWSDSVGFTGVNGSELNFYSVDSGKANFIKIEVEGAAAGDIATIKTNQANGIKWASDSGWSTELTTALSAEEGKVCLAMPSLVLKDLYSDKQTDHNLEITITENKNLGRSGNSKTFTLPVHVDLYKPQSLNISGSTTLNPKNGAISTSWSALDGNSGSKDRVSYYDLRYQKIAGGNCTIDSGNFDNQILPLPKYATPSTDTGYVAATTAGTAQSYKFFVTKRQSCKVGSVFVAASTKSECDTQSGVWTEANSHKNGDSYCAAIRAVDVVYGSDNLPLTYNMGTVSGNTSILSSSLVPTQLLPDVNPSYHKLLLKNYGDNGFVIADARANSDKGVVLVYKTTDIQNPITLVNPEANTQYFGFAIATGKFNKDAYYDIAVMTNVGTSSDARVYIFYGTADGISTTHGDMISVTNLIGTTTDRRISYSIMDSIGDFNGDGCEDWAFGNQRYNSDQGRVSIFYGKGDGCTGTYGASADISIDGKPAPLDTYDGNRFGFNVRKAGDLNGDSLSDFVVTTSNSSIKIIYGGLSTTPTTIQTYDLVPVTTVAPSELISYGKFNGDNIDDLIVSDRWNISVYFGSGNGINFSDSSQKEYIGRISDILAIDGYPEYTGTSTFSLNLTPYATDLDGDGYEDILVSGAQAQYIYSGIGTELPYHPNLFVPMPLNINNGNAKVLLLKNYGFVVCDTNPNKGNCQLYKQ